MRHGAAAHSTLGKAFGNFRDLFQRGAVNFLTDFVADIRHQRQVRHILQFMRAQVAGRHFHRMHAGQFSNPLLDFQPDARMVLNAPTAPPIMIVNTRFSHSFMRWLQSIKSLIHTATL